MSKVFKTSMNFEISWDEKHFTISKNGEEQSKTLKKKYFQIYPIGVEKRKNKLLPLLVAFSIITLGSFIENYSTWDYKNYPSYTSSYFCLFITIVILGFFLFTKKEIDKENTMYSKNKPELKLLYMEGDSVVFHTVEGTIDEIKEIVEEIEIDKGQNGLVMYKYLTHKIFELNPTKPENASL